MSSDSKENAIYGELIAHGRTAGACRAGRDPDTWRDIMESFQRMSGMAGNFA